MLKTHTLINLFSILALGLVNPIKILAIPTAHPYCNAWSTHPSIPIVW